MDLRRRFLIANKKSHNLPSEYQEVEYIESTATQYIIPYRWYPLNRTYGDAILILDMQFTAVPSSADVLHFGNGVQYTSGSTTKMWGIHLFKETSSSTRNTQFFFSSGPNEWQWMDYYDLDRHKFFIDFQNDEEGWDNNKTSFPVRSGLSSFIDQSAYFYLFARNSNGNAEWFSRQKLYYGSLKYGNHIWSEVIPCYSKATVTDSDGVSRAAGTIGLYDTVQNKFYVNKGTGTFLKGADIL